MKSLKTFSLFLSRNIVITSFGNDTAADTYDRNKTYLFQGSGLCTIYSGRWRINDTIGLHWPEVRDTYYPNLYQFLTETDACTDYCGYTDDAYLQVVTGACFPEQFANGICDKGCNNEFCYFDGGDCNQLCNCDNILLTNSICDIECNNTACDYDRFDCLIDDSDNMNYTANNYSLCMEETNCYYKFIGDGVCDDTCRKDEVCLYDKTDCNGCTGICSSFWSGWELWSNIVIPDYLMQLEEFCIEWYSVQSLTGLQSDFFKQYNCSTAFKLADILPPDGVVSAYEMVAILLFGIYNENDNSLIYYTKPLQANCSQCAPSTFTYYNY